MFRTIGCLVVAVIVGLVAYILDGCKNVTPGVPASQQTVP